ncbi:NAD(P)/FAD-dependent oxidoreductase [Amorphus sp. 3PC139-8]|uniref:NAD(P)/FAD-dependent oxidoreductase n=1 Tax=Amorphus sp. 3PC139-8 TaxID=2735676 RepID=UPI00345D1BA5
MATAVIIGAGQAGVQCAFSLRQNGWEGRVILLGAEEVAPYQRPPLSKAYLAGEMPVERLSFRDLAFYESEGIELRLSESATAIDRRDNFVITSEGDAIAYDKLVLATGTRPRRLQVPGITLEGVGYLRDVADVDRLKSAFGSAERVLVVGGGYIGLEVAAVAAKLGKSVVVAEAAKRVLARVTCPLVSAFYERFHRAKGVDIRTSAGVLEFKGEQHVRSVILTDGSEIDCDLAVVGIGVVPNEEVAMYAGLEITVGDGIDVDARMRTSDPDVYAIGDCARAPNPFADGVIRLESVANAIEQAKIAAASLCEKALPAPAVPWFWSDQYDLKLQTAGLVPRGTGHREVLRGEPDSGRFAVFYLVGDRLVAVDAINSAAAFNVAKRIIGRDGPKIDDALLADTDFDLRQLLANAAA